MRPVTACKLSDAACWIMLGRKRSIHLRDSAAMVSALAPAFGNKRAIIAVSCERPRSHFRKRPRAVLARAL